MARSKTKQNETYWRSAIALAECSILHRNDMQAMQQTTQSHIMQRRPTHAFYKMAIKKERKRKMGEFFLCSSC